MIKKYNQIFVNLLAVAGDVFVISILPLPCEQGPLCLLYSLLSSERLLGLCFAYYFPVLPWLWGLEPFDAPSRTNVGMSLQILNSREYNWPKIPTAGLWAPSVHSDGSQPMTEVGRDIKVRTKPWFWLDFIMAPLNLPETACCSRTIPLSFLPYEGSDLPCGLMTLQGPWAHFYFLSRKIPSPCLISPWRLLLRGPGLTHRVTGNRDMSL